MIGRASVGRAGLLVLAASLLFCVCSPAARAGTAVTTSCYDSEATIGQLGWDVREAGSFDLSAECPDYRLAMVGPAMTGQARVSMIYLPSTVTGISFTLAGGPPAWSGVAITLRACSLDECGPAFSPNADGSDNSVHLSAGAGLPDNAVTLTLRAKCAAPDLPNPDPDFIPIDWQGMFGFTPDCDWQMNQIYDTIIRDLKFEFEDNEPPVVALTDADGTPYGDATPWLQPNDLIYLQLGDADSFIAAISMKLGDADPEEFNCPTLPDGSFAHSCVADSGAVNWPLFTGNDNGSLPVVVSATDGAGNESSDTTIVRRDGTAPSAPEELAIAGATGQWVASPDLSVSWDNSEQDAPSESESGIARAHWKLRRTGGGVVTDVGDGYVDGEAIDQLEIEAKGAGDYRLSVSLIDAAGNEGEPGVVDFTYDDLAPAEPDVPTIPTINSELAGTGVTIDWTDPLNYPTTFSGICSHRFVLNAFEDYDPPMSEESGSVESPASSYELTPEEIADLPDGIRTFHVRAVSCVGRPGRSSHATVVIDRAPPIVTAKPAAGGWLAQGSAVRLMAGDSGTGVAQLSYSVDGAPAVTTASPSATVPVGQGMHTISFSATDRAGNVSEESSLSAGIDAIAPIAAFDAQDPSDPALVKAQVSDLDSGVSDAWLEYSEPDSAIWTRLVGDTQGDSPRTISAYFPDDSTLPAGSYRLRVVARDRAGNKSVTGTRVGGEEAVLNLPLRSQAALTLALSRSPGAPASNALLVKFGSTVQARGVLRDASGVPVAGAQIAIAQTISGAPKQIVTTASTDASGAYAATIPAGPSRAVEARFAGDSRLGGTSVSAAFSVRGSVTLRRPPARVASGKRFYLRGSVDPGIVALPRGGARIEIQHRDGKRWSGSVINRHTTSDGTFAVGITKRTGKRALRFTFRVAVTPESGWPYATGYSEIRRVVIR